jgi:hypothetical protein
MANGLTIHVSEPDFKSKPPEDRDWMLLQAITKIDREGCQWGKTGHKFGVIRVLWIIGAAFGAGLGASIGVWQAICR